MKAKGLMNEFWGEVFGTFVLVLLGDGVVANVGLAPRLAAPAYNWNTIAIGWCFAVVIAVYISGGVSGAHLNPAVTVGLAFKRGFPWKKVFPYILAQMIGAFLAAGAVFLIYRDGLVAAGLPNVWCTGPGSVFSASFWGGTGADRSRFIFSVDGLCGGVLRYYGIDVGYYGQRRYEEYGLEG